jgi:hypothetical protein
VPLEEEKYRKKYNSREIKWRNKTVFTYTIFFSKINNASSKFKFNSYFYKSDGDEFFSGRT